MREKPVTVIDIVTLPDYSEQVSHESVEEAGLDGRVVVLPENLTDFYSEETIERAGLNENPEDAAFGFVFFDDAYYAYSDWAWDDCYCDMTYCALAGAKLVVTDNTTVHPCYYIYETYGENYTMPGTEYFHLRENEEEQEQRGIQIDEATSYRIYLKYENDDYTGEIEELNEIYMP